MSLDHGSEGVSQHPFCLPFQSTLCKPTDDIRVFPSLVSLVYHSRHKQGGDWGEGNTCCYDHIIYISSHQFSDNPIRVTVKSNHQSEKSIIARLTSKWNLLCLVMKHIRAKLGMIRIILELKKEFIGLQKQQ